MRLTLQNKILNISIYIERKFFTSISSLAIYTEFNTHLLTVMINLCLRGTSKFMDELNRTGHKENSDAAFNERFA